MMNLAGMPAPLARAIEMLSTLPSIGPKTALRLSLHILGRSGEDIAQLAQALSGLHEGMEFCKFCGCFAEYHHCKNCQRAEKHAAVICVVEQPADVLMLERSGHFAGSYHVLHGRLSPVDGINPEQLWLPSLDKRVASDHVREMILATSATVDGEATAHFLAHRYSDHAITVSRIARGVPEGSELEYLDEYTLARALEQRITWT